MDYFSVKKYKCTHCQLQFHSKNVMNLHKKFHKSSTQLVCKLCLRVFHHKLMLRFHIKSHIGKRTWGCKICGKSFFNKANLQHHEAIHGGAYKCNLCGKAFSKVNLLKQHVVMDHAEDPTKNVLRCKVCGALCMNRIRLKSHMRVCDDKTVKPSCSSVCTDEEKAGPSSRL